MSTKWESPKAAIFGRLGDALNDGFNMKEKQLDTVGLEKQLDCQDFSSSLQLDLRFMGTHHTMLLGIRSVERGLVAIGHFGAA